MIRSILVLALAGLVGCSGVVGGSGSTRKVPPDADSPLHKRWLEDDASPSPLRRLTASQVKYAIEDLLDFTVPDNLLPTENAREGFVTFATSQTVDEARSRAFEGLAEHVAAEVDINALLSCGTQNRACIRAFVEDFAPKAFRRDVATAEVERYLTLFDLAQVDGFQAGARMVLQAMLGAPSFLYIAEHSVGALSPLEYAARLSFFLWSSVPDAALLDDARSGRLDDEVGRRVAVDRMLADPRARRTVRALHAQWLQLAKLKSVALDVEAFPEFRDSLAVDYAAETEKYAEHVFFDAANNTFSELLLGDYSMLNPTLADVYGVSTAAGFSKTDMSFEPRAGILMQGSTSIRTASPWRAEPIHRGNFLLKQVLCRELELPGDLNVMLPKPDPSRTYREQIEELTGIAGCNNCHSRLNPLGFGLDAFDAMGRYRPQENGYDVDSSGELVGLGDAEGFFNDGVEMMQIIANSDTAAECYAEKWYQFAMGRARDEKQDKAAFDGIFEAFDSSGRNLQELVVAITQSDAFLTRKTD